MSPLLTTWSGISVYPLGFGRGAEADQYFICNAATGTTSYSSAVDLNANGTLTWTLFDQNSKHMWASISKKGVINSTVGYTAANYSTPPLNAKSDTAGNVYVSAAVNGTGRYQLQPAKTTNTTVTWDRKLGNVANYTQYGVLDYDSSGNVYVAGITRSMRTSMEVVLAKWNSSGTIQWQKGYYSLSWSYNRCDDMVLAPNGNNIYMAAAFNSTSANCMGVMKVNSSGTVQWQRVATGLNPNNAGGRVAVDNSENVYNYYPERLTKFDSNGNYQWARFISASFQRGDVTTDSSGNVYIVWGNDVTIWVIKYNSSGTVQWQRSINSTTGTLVLGGYNDTSNHVSVSDTAIAIAAYDNNQAVLFKLPTDGTLTGNHTIGSITYTYAASSVSESSSSNSYSTHSVADTPLGATEADNALSISTQTPTYTKKVIP